MVIPETIEEAVRYYRALSFGTVDEEMIRTFAEEMVGIPRLLTSLGVEFKVKRTEPAYFPSFLTGQVKRIQVSPTGADGFRFLQDLVESRKVEVLMDTPATADPGSPNPGSLGSEGTKEGERITSSPQEVILACGYEYNGGCWRTFISRSNGLYFPWGTPGNTGTAFNWPLRPGGPLAHGDGRMGRFLRPETGPGGMRSGPAWEDNARGQLRLRQPIGKRFMPENTSLIHHKAPLRSFSSTMSARSTGTCPPTWSLTKPTAQGICCQQAGTFSGDVGRPGGLSFDP
jgi:hypothetical protein